MKWFWRLLVVVALVAGGVWLWRAFHPSPEKIIRGQLRQLAGQVSFVPGESDLTRLGKLAGITRYFTEEVEMKLAFRDFAERRTITHELIQSGLAGMRTIAPAGLAVEFLDVKITLAPGGDFASVELTMNAHAPGDNTLNVQEMKIALRRHNETWLIYRVETVRTLK